MADFTANTPGLWTTTAPANAVAALVVLRGSRAVNTGNYGLGYQVGFRVPVNPGEQVNGWLGSPGDATAGTSTAGRHGGGLSRLYVAGVLRAVAAGGGAAGGGSSPGAGGDAGLLEGQWGGNAGLNTAFAGGPGTQSAGGLGGSGGSGTNGQTGASQKGGNAGAGSGGGNAGGGGGGGYWGGGGGEGGHALAQQSAGGGGGSSYLHPDCTDVADLGIWDGTGEVEITWVLAVPVDGTGQGTAGTAGSAAGVRVRTGSAHGGGTSGGTGEAITVGTAVGAGVGVTSAHGTGGRTVGAVGAGQAATAGVGAAEAVTAATGSGPTSTAGAATGAGVREGTAAGHATTAGSGAGEAITAAAGLGSTATAGAGTAASLITATGAGGATTAGYGFAEEGQQGTGHGTAATAGTGTAVRQVGATGTGSTGTAGAAAGVRVVEAGATGIATTSAAAAGLVQHHATGIGSASTAAAGVGVRVVEAAGTGMAATGGHGDGGSRVPVEAVGHGAAVTTGTAVGEIRPPVLASGHGSAATAGHGEARSSITAVGHGATGTAGAGFANGIIGAVGHGGATTWGYGLGATISPVVGPVCSPWLDLQRPADARYLCGCSADQFAPEMLAVKLEEAQHLLYMATGRKFPGLCTETVRPCAGGCCGVQYLEYNRAGGSRPIVGDCGCGGGLGGVGCAARGIMLPQRPVVRVDQVMIDGQVLPPESYRLADGNVLMRTDGTWPCNQDLSRPAGMPRTFAVRYTYGARPGPAGLTATASLACELAAACTPGAECALPQRLQNITREGITMTVMDPFDFLDQRRFGIYNVDAWIAGENPNGLDRAGRVLSPSLMGRHHR